MRHVGSSSLTRDWTQAPPHWEQWVLAPGPPGKFQQRLHFQMQKLNLLFFFPGNFDQNPVSQLVSPVLPLFNHVDIYCRHHIKLSWCPLMWKYHSEGTSLTGLRMKLQLSRTRKSNPNSAVAWLAWSKPLSASYKNKD